MSTTTKQSTENARPSLTLKRHIKASPEKVFAAWTQAEHLSRWFGPGDVKVVKAEADLRVGGRFDISMTGSDGEKHGVGGIYREIIANELLLFSWAWMTTPERQSLVKVTFAPRDGGTDITLVHEQFADEAVRDRHAHRWNGSLDKLEGLFVCDTAPEGGARWAHGLFHWNELMTRDVETAKGFYEASIGWRFQSVPMEGGTYWIAMSGDRMAGGIFEMAGPEFEGVPDHWIAYIGVEDVDACVERAIGRGAEIIKPQFDVPGVGRIAIIRQPGGAVIGWMTPSA